MKKLPLTNYTKALEKAREDYKNITVRRDQSQNSTKSVPITNNQVKAGDQP